MELKTNAVKAGIVFALLGASIALLFVPIAAGAEEVKGMFVLLTGIAVRDYFGGIQSDKRVEDVKQAMNPTPPAPVVNEE